MLSILKAFMWMEAFLLDDENTIETQECWVDFKIRQNGETRSFSLTNNEPSSFCASISLLERDLGSEMWVQFLSGDFF